MLNLLYNYARDQVQKMPDNPKPATNFYNAVFDPEKWALRDENAVIWNDLSLKTNTYRGQTPFE